MKNNNPSELPPASTTKGKNRSRKPVQVSSTAAVCTTSSINRNLPISTSSSCSLPSSCSFSFSPLSSSPVASEIYSHYNPFLYSHSATSTRTPGSGLSFQNNTSSHHFFDSGTGISTLGCYVQHGTREGVDEKSFFPEASGSVRVVPDSYQPLTMSSYESYPQSEYQGSGDSASKQRQQQQEQQCFVLGTDIKKMMMKLRNQCTNFLGIGHRGTLTVGLILHPILGPIQILEVSIMDLIYLYHR